MTTVIAPAIARPVPVRHIMTSRAPLIPFRKGQRKDDPMADHCAGSTETKGGVHRQGAKEDASIPHREAHEPKDRPALSLDRAIDRKVNLCGTDNRVLICADPRRLLQIDGLSAAKIEALLRKRLSLLPLTRADRRAGYRDDISIPQAEFSLTHVPPPTSPLASVLRAMIRQNLDLSRPEEVQLIFNRPITRRTAGPTGVSP